MIITGKKFSKPEMSRVINGDVQLPEAAEQEEAKERLDVLLAQKYKSYNRSTLQKFIKNGFVTVRKEVVTRPGAKVPVNAHLALHVPTEEKRTDFEPEILYEDENVMVVNKPVGMLSETKGEFCPEESLSDYALPAHRLDRDTSGVVILAKSKAAREFLQRQFAERKTHKTYFAVVEGRPKLDAARLDLPIGRDYGHKVTFKVDPNGRSAETFYQVLASDGEQSLVRLMPTTGRTHQLRVHMKYIGHPIVGDIKYGSGLGKGVDRMFLHAAALEITIPGSDNGVEGAGRPVGERRTFVAPVPKEFVKMVKGAKMSDVEVPAENGTWAKFEAGAEGSASLSSDKTGVE